MFRESFEFLIQDFATYRPLLSKIKNEYERMLEKYQAKLEYLPPMKQKLVTLKEDCKLKVSKIKHTFYAQKEMLEKEMAELRASCASLRESNSLLSGQLQTIQYARLDEERKRKEAEDSKETLLRALQRYKDKQHQREVEVSQVWKISYVCAPCRNRCIDTDTFMDVCACSYANNKTHYTSYEDDIAPERGCSFAPTNVATHVPLYLYHACMPAHLHISTAPCAHIHIHIVYCTPQESWDYFQLKQAHVKLAAEQTQLQEEAGRKLEEKEERVQEMVVKMQIMRKLMVEREKKQEETEREKERERVNEKERERGRQGNDEVTGRDGTPDTDVEKSGDADSNTRVNSVASAGMSAGTGPAESDAGLRGRLEITEQKLASSQLLQRQAHASYMQVCPFVCVSHVYRYVCMCPPTVIQTRRPV